MVHDGSPVLSYGLTGSIEPTSSLPAGSAIEEKQMSVTLLTQPATTKPAPSNLPAAVAAPPRNVAVDAYRGLVMLLMMGEVMRFASVARAFPDSVFWRILAYNQTHVEWAGMSLHDTIQPGFTFLAGVALPYSIANRVRKGESFGRQLFHTVWRSFILIALGIFLRSTHSPQTNFTFEDTLTQIGLGYTVAFLLAHCRPKWQWMAFGILLFGYWLAWALYPSPGPAFNFAAVGVPEEWVHHFSFTGFSAHWNKNSNLGQAFDVWFLNLFPRPSRFLYNDGGYLTLSFIPTLGTILLGVRAGDWFRAEAPKIPIKRFLVAGALLIAAGLLLHFTGICPIVKRIWTPAWTLFSGGVCFFFLAAFSWIIDVKSHRRWAFPLIVVGMNSIAAYLIAHLWEDFIQENLHINLGYAIFRVFGTGLESLMLGATVMVIYWLVLYSMYRKQIFFRI
jgi:heparan-alpha-glucosaminide N-acetyltransferase